MTVTAKIPIVPQKAWIFNATLRENVLFGLDYDETRYKEALRVSCLVHDVNKMDYGDQTVGPARDFLCMFSFFFALLIYLQELGAKGVNLSGGQKQRVSIARAVYADADLYLLDDCLSALDAHVAKEVFDTCIIEHLKKRGKTVIFATNRVVICVTLA